MEKANAAPPLFMTHPASELSAFCRQHGIRSLALFGSVLHGNSRPSSDIDLLVEYDPQQRVGLFAMAQTEADLSVLFGQPVDLRTAQDLSPYFRDSVLVEAQILYESQI